MTNEEMFQNIESFTVGLDDTFSFHCTQCGKCCIHRTDIILSPRDIFKMAKALTFSGNTAPCTLAPPVAYPSLRCGL